MKIKLKKTLRLGKRKKKEEKDSLMSHCARCRCFLRKKKPSIDSGKLTSISNILDHNFFLDFYGNYKETSANLAIQAGLYIGKYHKLLVDYERVNRELSDSKIEINRLKLEISRLEEENIKLKSNS